MKKSLKIPATITYLFIFAVIIYNLSLGNLEFLGYGLVIGLLYFILLKADKYYNFSTSSIWLFSIWVFTHFLGGNLYVKETRLYDLILINILGDPFYILKYDQLIHAYTYFVIGILVYQMMSKHFQKGHKKSLILFAILASCGVGLLNEILEFSMVVFADAADAVGDYYNTALDLVFNLIGAIIGVWFISKLKN